MSLDTIICEIERSGGVLKLEGEHIRVLLPSGMENVASILRERKPELLEILRQRGGRVASFPACPACGSFALFRERTGEDFECLTCCAQGITEVDARRRKERAAQ